MGFGTNYSVADFDLIPVGEYECIITNAETKQLQSGACKVAFTLTIRNDIQQACKDRTLFVDIWRKKEPNANDMAVDGFNFVQLMAAAKAAQIPDGANFESLQQFLTAMVGRLVRATVTHRDYQGRKYENVDQLRGLSKTKFPECRHVQKQRQQAQQTYAAPTQQAYAPQQQAYAQPPAPLRADSIGEFTDILQDGQLPF